ncbi:MAG: SGNH/GDSL hydrolase family protein [Pirellulales bacterium]|nr:SGNH/GDSL hydrolase family protein [Pirellulales bacterium]
MWRRPLIWGSFAVNLALLGVLLWGSGRWRSRSAETPLNDPITRTYQWVHAHKLTLEGRAFRDTLGPYDRLPQRAETLVPRSVWQLAHQSAGICVRFQTDAREIAVRWQLRSERLALADMPAAAVSGLDLYARDAKGKLRWLAVAHPTGIDNACVLIDALDGSLREYWLYLPLYNGVEMLQIGVPAESRLEPASPRAALPLVFYGTSITQGRSASRPGMAYPAILGRLLDRPVINLGFSGSCKMEPAVVSLLAEIEAAVYVVDCLPNMNGELVRQRTEGVVRQLHAARPGVPLVLVEDRTYPAAAFRADLAEHNQASRAALRQVVERLQAEGIGPLVLVSGDELLRDDHEACADGSHPTDVGMRHISERLRQVLEAQLQAAAGQQLGGNAFRQPAAGSTATVSLVRTR